MNRLLAFLLFVPSLLMAQVPDHVPTEGLVAWYPFYQSLEEVVGGHDGQSDSPTFETGGGLFLQTGDSPVNLPQSLEINEMDGSLTLGGWIRLDDSDMVWGVVMDLTDGDEDNSWTNRATLSMEKVQGELRWVTGLKTGDDMANNISRVLSLPDPDIVGLWRHVMAVWDVQDVVKIYVNGSPLDGSLDISDAANFNLVGGQPGSRRIGGRAHNTNQDRLWHGAMKDIGVWGRALSATEIQSLALVTQQPGCTDPDACNFNPTATQDDGSCLSPPVIDLGEDIETCEDSVTLDAGDGFGSYFWSTGETSQSITVSESGLYEATVSSHPANEGSLSFDGDGDWVSIAPIQSDVLEVGGSASIKITYAGYGALFSGAPTSGPAFPMIFRTEINDLGNGIAEYKTYHRSASLDVNEEPVSDVFPYNGVDWNTVLVSIDNMNGKYTLYHNGQMFLDYEFEPASFSSSGLDWGIGNLVYNGGGTNYFSGFIDHVAVYDEYLTEADANDLFGCTLSLNPVHEWDFEEGQGEVAIDATVNENHGQLIGATWSDQTSSHSNCESCEASDEILVVMPNCDGYCGEGTVWDPFNQECIVAIPTDTDFDGCVAAGDLLNLLGTFGSCPPIPFSGPCQGQDHVTYQGYDYDIVAIGSQCWFAENLQAENYLSGSQIPLIETASEWMGMSTGGRRVYGLGDAQCGVEGDTIGFCNEPPASVVSDLGYLYNWHVVSQNEGVCPANWHVPNDSDFETLIASANQIEGDALSSLKSQTGWADGKGGTNTSGFNALGSGYGGNLGNFSSDGFFTCFWSVDEAGSLNARQLHIDERPYSPLSGSVFLNDNNKRYALSIRCIKDQ